MKLIRHFEINPIRNKLLLTYFILAIVRIILVFGPQVGYIHPDEFFQSVEVMAGEEFGLEHTRTWEFNGTFPVRSVAIPLLIYKIPLNLFRIFTLYINYFFGIDIRTTYALLVFPRLLMCAISFINDWSLYRLCRSYGRDYDIRLVALASSFVVLVFGTRTFSNSIEMALCSALLYLVAESMIHSNTVICQKDFIDKKYQEANSTVDKVFYFKLRSTLPPHSLNKCFILAAICVTGCFNRPTFIVFGMPIIFFWLLRGMGSRTVSFFDFNLRIICFILSATPFIILFVIIDSMYYGFLTMSELGFLQIGIENFVVTPVNFVRYNINPENTGQHGVHPKYLHLLVNIPLLYNILGIYAILSFFNKLYRFCRAEYRKLPRSQSLAFLMNSAIFTPVAVLSLINHQEARFLIPITVPIIFLHAPKLKSGFVASSPAHPNIRNGKYLSNKVPSAEESPRYLLWYWYLINICFTVFFGFVHQGGIIQLARHLSNSPAYPHQYHSNNNVHTHLITSHTYSVPMSLMYLPSTQTLLTNPQTGQKYNRKRQFFLYEYGSMPMQELHRKVKLILDMNEMKLAKTQQNYKQYLAIPSSLTEDLIEALYRSNNTLVKYQQVKIFYPHFSTEAIPRLFVKHLTELNTDVFDLDQTCPLFGNHRDVLPYSVQSILRQFSSVIHQFGLVLYRIEIRRKHKQT